MSPTPPPAPPPQRTTHLELDKANMLSAVASFTPFSDFNQSPRNMYQCQVSVRGRGGVGGVTVFKVKFILLCRWANKRWGFPLSAFRTEWTTSCTSYRYPSPPLLTHSHLPSHSPPLPSSPLTPLPSPPLQTPQSPVVRPMVYQHYGVDDFPVGTNAVVAVISYTVSWTGPQPLGGRHGNPSPPPRGMTWRMP